VLCLNNKNNVVSVGGSCVVVLLFVSDVIAIDSIDKKILRGHVQ